ncbi:MAG: hypothetical protein AB1758_11470, partial [Candidatus Eremiobacterota bacterium]
PGDPVDGCVELSGAPPGVPVTVTLQGEEIVGANHLFRSYVLPVAEEALSVESTGELVQRIPFRFAIPYQAPPSYASWDLRCQYFLKARAQSGWRNEITRLHLTVLPPALPPPTAHPAELVVEDEGIRLSAHVASNCLFTGNSLHGHLTLSREKPEAPLPARISFRLAAIEESKVSDYRHVLWVQSHDIEPTEDAEMPLGGLFDFPVDQTAPFTGEWNLFRVHYGFRVGLTRPGRGRERRESLPILVFRDYEPARPTPSGGTGLSPAPTPGLTPE